MIEKNKRPSKQLRELDEMEIAKAKKKLEQSHTQHGMSRDILTKGVKQVYKVKVCPLIKQ
jgi:hypothetical protein